MEKAHIKSMIRWTDKKIKEYPDSDLLKKLKSQLIEMEKNAEEQKNK